MKRLCLEFSEKSAYVITEGNDENEDEYDEQITHTWRNELDKTIKALNRLSMFTEDLTFDPLISKPTHIINQWVDKGDNW